MLTALRGIDDVAEIAKEVVMVVRARKSSTKCPGEAHCKAKRFAHADGAAALLSATEPRARKIVISAAALAIAGSLAMPISAWAAEWVSVEGVDYYEAASGTGLDGGTWSWDGADDFQLSGYSGTGILAGGDLTVTLEGENEIHYTEDEYGSIYVEDGDLTITGDGSLSVSESDYSAIEAINGDIVIEGTTVSAVTDKNMEGFLLSGAIKASNGSISIIDSTVDVTWNEPEASTGTVHAIYATTDTDYADDDDDVIDASSATINIIDSTVTATVLAPTRLEEDLAWIRAISSFSNVEGCAPVINIENSTVDASASGGMAILAWSRGIDEVGVINITDSTLPEGCTVQDIYYEKESEEEYSPFSGQVLGAGSGTITDIDDSMILDSVLIESADSAEPTEPVDLDESVEPASEKA